MNLRRTVILALAVLVTSGCVAVPSTPGPRPPAARPGELAAAADRPPAPIPTWSEPTQAAPREELSTTGPRPEPTPVTTAPTPAAAAAEPFHTDKPGRRTRLRKSPETMAKKRTPKGLRSAAGKNRKPRSPQKPQAAPRRRQAANGQAPEMRRLCAQAKEIGAPMGAADLCRSVYGR
ncbi:hypothetical protein ACFTWS_38490 [Streptomyces sp. NPDC057027]|uniref:hypothetical protein n=1 Tax=Streptomyces sp. NPDC057027 TaxID=3346004 RepID=UPI00362962C2